MICSRDGGISTDDVVSCDAPAGRVVLAASSTGTGVSVVWPETSRFAVYSQRTGEVWERVDEGSGTAVVWALASPTYAVLHQAPVSFA